MPPQGLCGRRNQGVTFMQSNRPNQPPKPPADGEFWVDLPAPLPEMIAGMRPSRTDPQGSWTGLPLPDELETPVQDADDL